MHLEEEPHAGAYNGNFHVRARGHCGLMITSRFSFIYTSSRHFTRTHIQHFNFFSIINTLSYYFNNGVFNYEKLIFNICSRSKFSIYPWKVVSSCKYFVRSVRVQHRITRG